jgi:hypothetical protein
MAPLIKLQIRAWKIQVMHICIVICKTGQLWPQWPWGEIASYKYAWTTFVERHVYKGGKF